MLFLGSNYAISCRTTIFAPSFQTYLTEPPKILTGPLERLPQKPPAGSNPVGKYQRQAL